MEPSRSLPGLTAVPRAKRLVVIVWLFVAIVICLLTAAVYSVELLSAGRAFVGAEGLWTRAQKDAVFHLTRYTLNGTDADFDAFERAIAVPRGVRRARMELAKSEPDYNVVRDGFLQGHNHPADIDPMITLFRRFRHFGPVEQAVRLWERADDHVEDLVYIAHEIHAAGPKMDPQLREGYVDRIARINASLSNLGEAMSASLGEAQRAAQTVLLAGMLLLAGALLITGIIVSQRFVAQNERLQETLRENEAQLRNMIESAPLPLLIIRAADQKLIYANERALQQFALDVDSLRGRTLADFHVDAEGRAGLNDQLSRQGSVRDHEIHLKDAGGRQFWLLMSAQPVHFAGETCLLTAFANIDDRKRMQDDMRRKAMHDQLTGLPNRASFLEALDRGLRKARRRPSHFSVLFVDLDRFKEVNDTMGHTAGDQLLLAVSERLTKAVRQSDLVARLAGDEFVVLIEEHKGPEEVMIVAQKILALLERPVMLEWREVAISASVGIASFPEDGEDAETLMKHADLAMYQAKDRGRNNFQFYSSEFNRLSAERSEIEKRIRAGIERDEFFLQYQPEIELATGKVVAVEALVRWRSPPANVVMPPDFLPLAEENGTIIPIGRWVLARALQDLNTWRDAGLDLTLSINISARQLQQPELADNVRSALQAHGVPPKCLRLEVPETALMIESDAAARTVRALQSEGVDIALDNFGTGYSSLGLVRGYSLRAVKIDRSLVSSCPNKRECAALVQAVSAMGRNLGLTVIAGGVETEDERRVVAALGCDRAQGNFIGRPVEAPRVLELARRHTANVPAA